MTRMIRHKASPFPRATTTMAFACMTHSGAPERDASSLASSGRRSANRCSVTSRGATSPSGPAYDLIESLAKDGKRLAPVSVYRILDVLQSAGLVHRLESRNAFFACMTEHATAPQTITLVCEGCERVTEADAPEAWRAVGQATRAGGFRTHNVVIEVSGACADCHDASKRAGSC